MSPPYKPCGTHAAYQRHLKAKETPCDPCREAARLYMRDKHVKRRDADPDKMRAYNLESSKRWRTANPEKAYLKSRNSLLRRRYSITQEQWELLFVQQGSVCACCGTSKPSPKHGWATDHDHATGRIRGILCHKCNLLLGRLGDSVEGCLSTCALFLTYLQKAA